MPFIGRLGEAGLSKENTLGTLETPPKRFRRFIPPFNFSTDIALIKGQGVQGIPDSILKVAQGPGQLKGAKLKYELDPEEVGDDLVGVFGTDTPTEVASLVVTGYTPFVVSSGIGENDKIDFKVGVGSELNATVAAGTYTAYDLAKAIKTAMDAAGGGTTFTVAFSLTTKKFTITPSASTVTLLWLSGTNNAKGLYALIGWGHVDTAAAASQTSTVAVTCVASNDAIDFTEGAGAQVTGHLTPGTYKMGTSSGTAGTLCALVKTIMEAANGTADTYTVTYSATTQKVTAVNGTEVFVFKWSTGTNTAISAMALLGFTTDSASALSNTSDGTVGITASHVFSVVQSAILPTFSWWQKNGVNYPQHVGCLLSKSS